MIPSMVREHAGGEMKELSKCQSLGTLTDGAAMVIFETPSTHNQRPQLCAANILDD